MVIRAMDSQASTFNQCIYRTLIVALCVALAVLTGNIGRAATLTWDGGGTPPTNLDVPANWSGDTLPLATGDTAEWNGTVAGPLSLIYSNPVWAGNPGSLGINVSMTAGQTSSLSLDSITNTALRMNNITIASGAGAFTLGDGVGTFNITVGGSGGQTHTWSNASANAATINSDVVFGLGGGGGHTFLFTGSGAWNVAPVIFGSGGGTIAFQVSGDTTVNLTGTFTNNTGGANGSLVRVTGSGGSIPVLNINGGTISLISGNGSSVVIANDTTNTMGVINQNGGLVRIAGNLMLGVQNTTTSAFNYAFYNMSDGAFYQTGANRFRIGNSSGSNSAALFYLSGGVVTTTVGVALNDLSGVAGFGGAAVLYVSGGIISNSAATQPLGIGGRQGQSEVTIGGNGAVVVTTNTILGGSVASGVSLAGDAGRTAVLNLGTGAAGGVLQTRGVSQDTSFSPNGYLNFNGGTLKANANNPAFLQGLTQATIYGGGATIDDNGFAITVGQALLAPTGSGVVSIAVSGASGYKGAPYVQITGGGATTPATAIALLDGAGNVTNIVITSPGTGYTSAPTVTLIGGGGSAGTVTPTLGANTSGGLTKLGAGVLTLSGANTYTGETKINSGTLALASGGTISSSATITVGTGAFLDASAIGGLTLSSGQLLRGNGTVTGGLTVQSGGTLSPGSSPGFLNVSGGLTLNSGATFQVELNGTAAGSQYDQLVVTSGGIALGNGTLSVALGFTPTLGDAFTIISNAPNSTISGTFAGLVEGGSFNVGATQFQITYLGNGGNDVVLTVVPEPSSVALCGLGLMAMTIALRRRTRGME